MRQQVGSGVLDGFCLKKEQTPNKMVWRPGGVYSLKQGDGAGLFLIYVDKVTKGMRISHRILLT